MNASFLNRLAMSATLAMSAGLVGTSARPAEAAGSCVVPLLSAVVNPAASLPLSPHIVLTASGLSLPAQGRFDWGDGQFGVARLDDGDSALGVVTDIQPVYAAAGSYSLKLAVTDACGATTVLVVPVSVPLRLPAAAAITCPTSLDASGFCVVPLGSVSTFTVTGGGTAGPWHWNGRSANSTTTTGRYPVLLDEQRPVSLQATALTPTGWLVTPVLKVIAVQPSRPRITTFSDPLMATVDQPLEVRFTLPAASTDGAASIHVDDVKVADGTSASLRLDPGSHTITYVVIEPDGSVIERQAVVVVSRPGPPISLIAAAALTLFVIGAALSIGVRRRRRHRIVSDGEPIATPLVSPTRGTTP